MLKILADQALEEGRHDASLDLYRASLATAPPPSSPSSSPSSPRLPRAGAAAHVVDSRKSSLGANDGRAANPLEERGAEAPAAAAEAEAGAATAVTGDALHGVGVALLAAGEFREACRAWKRGVRKAPNHIALRAQAEKEVAYRPIGGEHGITTAHGGGDEGPQLTPSQGKQAGSAACVAESVYGDGGGGDSHECFASTPGGLADIFLSRAPVLSPEECSDVIKAAEDYSQANGGWTTSRHYAVPTTDLPVHVLKPVLPWFRSLVSKRLFPTLAENFSLRGGAQRVFVHDAFVVRYEEGKQRHLPLHRDQSTHSFTIALNGLDQYTGGGTFFPCLGRSLRPPEGHALSFRGDILHGGDPLLSGVRYIIACFCYHDDNGNARGDDGGYSSGDSVVDGGEIGDEEPTGGGERHTRQQGLDGLGRESCTEMEKVEKDERTGNGSRSSSNGAVGDSPRSSQISSSSVGGGDGEVDPSSHAHGNEKPGCGGDGKGAGKGGIEFRGDTAFSFSFGFG